MDCIFCSIINGEIPSSKVYENDSVFAFDDINPKAPVHVLIIPKKHIPDINSLDINSSKVLGDIFLAAARVAEIKGIKESGYRVVVNNGPDAGQEVFHLHIHVLGGTHLGLKMDEF